jgi:3-dehydroquinate dehydratase-2
MERRGLENIEIFGPMTLVEYERKIESYADEFGVQVAFFHSNDESKVVERVAGLPEQDFDALIVNPAGYMQGATKLVAAIKSLGCSCVEIHVSNPAARGITSPFAPVCKATIAGFGVNSYRLALAGLASAK